MKVIFPLMIIGSFFVFSTCSTPSRSYSSNGVINIVVDHKLPAQTIKTSSLFKPPKTIILETQKEALIGSIESLQIYDGFIYVLDAKIAGMLFVFDMNGKFIRRIGRKGRAPGEFSRISDFTIDADHRTIYVNDDPKIHQYSTDGTYIKTFTVENLHFGLYHIQYYNGCLYADVVPHSDKNDEMLLKVDPSTGKILERYFSSSDYNCSWNKSSKMETGSFKARLGNPPKFSQTFMYQIISLDNMKPYIEIENDKIATKEDVELLKKNNDGNLFDFSKMNSIHNYIEGNSFIFFNYYCSPDIMGVLYDINDNTVKQGFLKNDLLYKDYNMYTKFQFSDNKGAYSMIDINEMPYFLELIEKKQLVESLDKINQLRKLDEESNPVIFYYEFKDEK